jgi:hypothetical protein
MAKETAGNPNYDILLNALKAIERKEKIPQFLIRKFV